MPAMTPFGTNTNARKKRVYYTEESDIYEGMPVCYEFDATANVLNYDKEAGGDAPSQSSPSTTAEGYQNEGKFLRVEDPDSDNIHAFAGVVAGTSHSNTAGPRWLDIYIPNGAVVPVRTDASTTVDVTVLGIASGSTLCASGGRPVALACETVNRSNINGITLAKLDPNMFGLYQNGVGSGQTFNGLTGAVANTLKNVFANTSGSTCNLLVHTTVNGELAASHNEWSVLGYLAVSGSITAAGYSRAVLAQTVMSGTINHGGAVACGLHAQITGTVTNTLAQRCAAAIFEYGLSENPNTGDADVIFLYANGAEDVDSYVHMWGDGERASVIWKFSGCGGLSTSALIKLMGTGGMWTNTGSWMQIPIDINGTTYYIPAGAALSEA